MKYLLIKYGNGTQMVKVLTETTKRLTVLRFEGSRRMWSTNHSFLKVNDSRIIQELGFFDTISYIADRERGSKVFYEMDRNGINVFSKADHAEQFEANWNKLVDGIKTDFTNKQDDLK